MAAARKPSLLHWVLALFFSLLSLLFVLVILLSGVGGRVVAEYMTIDTSGLSIPAKLSSSVLLTDISTVSGQDWVGSDASAASLGLADTYTLSLLTACAHDRDGGETTCGAPEIGFNFDPGADLRLDSTSVRSTFSAAYSDELQTYARVAMFLGVGYVLAALLTAIACLCAVASRCLPPATIRAAAGLEGVATLVLLAAAIASVVEFMRLRGAFHNAFAAAGGLEVRSGRRMFGFGFAAAAAALASTLHLVFLSRAAGQPTGGGGGGDAASRAFDAKIGVPGAATPGLLGRVTTWGRHKYVQVEKQRPVLHQRGLSGEDDRRGLIASEGDFSHEYPNDFALGPMQQHKGKGRPGGHSRNPSAAYDPHPNAPYGTQVDTVYDPLKV
ncbi:hypothetical protein GGS23DRAFT_282638 [Durotheca rogersii]|uniref:uncharacterized protein n=1 Tax=Durotheca rogersii TaxID=419775 RepID=UPI00221FF954|nr:uncharacterized protein GGS23DRAFT_282638 [Durotheca rogersii]KAI5866682.1 hypothetical protein GGS23DRAFT_282638 [Durotheca rogersii]